MKILLVSNHATERCGVAAYGRHLFNAVQDTGIHVAPWHSTPEAPLPDKAAEFELIHVNWHAATVGHLKVGDFPAESKLSVFIHEPASVCNLVEKADLVISTEPIANLGQGFQRFGLFPNPCLDYTPRSEWDGLEVTLGFSGIRRDGLDRIEGAIERQKLELVDQDGPPGLDEVNPHAWRLCASAKDPDGWLSDEAELERLAACAMSVFHYHSGNSGQSYAVMTGVAARRPLLVNRNRMLEHIWGEPGIEEEVYVVDDVAEGIHQVVKDLREGREKRPFELAKRRSWSVAIEKLVGWWGELY